MIAIGVPDAVLLAYDTAVSSPDPSGSRSRQDGMLLSKVHTRMHMTATKAASARYDVRSENVSTAHVITGEAMNVETPVDAMQIPRARPLCSLNHLEIRMDTGIMLPNP